VSTNSLDGLAEYAQIRYLSPAECRFDLTAGGFLRLELGAESYNPVYVFRSFPLSLGDRYLSVRDDKNNEIGIIRDLAEFNLDQANLVRGELERRYFTPIIKKVHKMKEEFGYIYWEVETDRGARRFTTKGSHDCILPVGENRLMIIDVDGNRFEVTNYRELDTKSARLIETLM